MDNALNILEIGVAFTASAFIMAAWLAALAVYKRRRVIEARRRDYRMDVFNALAEATSHDNAIRIFAVYPDLDTVIEEARRKKLAPVLASLIIRKSDSYSRQFAREVSTALNSASTAGSKD